MADNQDERSSEDLTEEPSAHRLEEFRQKGQVAQSREVSGLFVLFAAGVFVYIMGPTLGAQLYEFMQDIFKLDFSVKKNLTNENLLFLTLHKAFKICVTVVLPIALASFFVGILASFIQIGSIFSTETLKPDLERINPIKGFKRFFSLRQIIEGLRLTLKLVIVSVAAFILIKSQLLKNTSASFFEVTDLIKFFGLNGKSIFLVLCCILFVFAGLDFWHQRFEHLKQLRMTKQEAKQEFKEREGDPQIRARIRSIQREMARKRMMAAVKKADVVVTNPTHIAIALVYSRDSMLAPKVVAKGADLIAQKIKALAVEAGVPLVENIPLARTLFKSVKLNQYIPRTLYQAVAEVLAYVYRLRNKTL